MEIDAKSVRLSENFLLSDFLGCHSVYSRGLKNDPNTLTRDHLREAKALCEHVLEPILAEFGPISVTYGYISPELSREIVKYQDPDKPSYHRWDDGAAADIVVHDWVQKDNETSAPIFLAHEIDKMVPYSRMITYSESQGLCVASRAYEIAADTPRKAFYENRYMGIRGSKPKFITKSKMSAGREREYGALCESGLPFDWRGAGYPTYHLGGKRQLQHRRTSRYTLLTDFLCDPEVIAAGIPNVPPMTVQSRLMFEAAGRAYDELLAAWEVPRLSITGGYLAPRASAALGRDRVWRTGDVTFVVALPPSRKLQSISLPETGAEVYVSGGIAIVRSQYE